MERGFFGWIIYILEEYWPYFLQGTWLTLVIAVLGTLIGFAPGFAIGMVESVPMPEKGNPLKKLLMWIARSISKVFVEVFRGTPMMVQAMVIYYGIRQVYDGLSPFGAAVLVTLLNTGAYMAETVRGGIISIDPGQTEGAKALGMGHFTTMFLVVLPQAFRNIFPEMVNMYLTNLKMTSVLNVINVSELYYVTRTAASGDYELAMEYMGED